jgi:HAD superfamily hydrolase (TIGR01509 family)
MNKNNIKAIIFDFDGVIVNSEPVHEKAEVQTCLEYGMKVPRAEWENFRGTKIENIFSFVSQKYGTGQEPIEKMIERKIELYLAYAMNELELIPGVYDFLSALKKDRKYRLALTTSGRLIQQSKILNKFGLVDFFEVIVTSDDCKLGKPNPEPYLVTIKKLLEQSQDCLVIEDSDNGIISAKGAGCQACGITNTFAEEKLKSAGADMVVNKFEELWKVLQ